MYPFSPHKIDQVFKNNSSYGPHEGIDLNGLGGGNTDCGTKLLSISSGECVSATRLNKNYGNLVVIATFFGGVEYFIRYAHCDQFLVKAGDKVTIGQEIATMGSTGNSTACHLHLDILKKKPSHWRYYTKSVDDWFVNPVWFIENYKEEEMVETIQVELKDWERARKSMDLIEGIHSLLGLEGDHIETPLEKYTSVIGGYKGEATNMRNQLKAAEAEIINREEQVSRLKKQVLDEQSARKTEVAALSEAQKAISKLRGDYEGRLASLQEQVDQAYKDKGALQTQIAVMEAEMAELKKGSTSPLTLFDVLKMIFPKIIKWLKGTTLK